MCINAKSYLVPNLGCAASDYTGFPKGNVALIMRGNCTFQDKIVLAGNGGAWAALIYNDGADPSREGLFSGNPGQLNKVPGMKKVTSYSYSTSICNAIFVRRHHP
jgi:hypothetical protein